MLSLSQNILLVIDDEGTAKESLASLREHLGSFWTASELRLDTRYYSADVTVRSMHYGDIFADSGNSADSTPACEASAVIVFASRSLDRGKQCWADIAAYFGENCVRLFIASDSLLADDTMISNLLEWAAKFPIEVLADVLFDDDMSVSRRLREALECAEWPVMVHKSVHTLSDVDSLRAISEQDGCSDDVREKPLVVLQGLHGSKMRSYLDKNRLNGILDDLLNLNKTSSDDEDDEDDEGDEGDEGDDNDKDSDLDDDKVTLMR